MKNNAKREKLSNAPIALVLIQLRYSPVADINDHINNIQVALRNEGFPEFDENPSFEIKVTPDGALKPVESNQWTFSSSSGYENIILDSNQLTFQVTKYDVFESFYKVFERICLSVFSQIPGFQENIIIKRLGLRYVDRIVISEGKNDCIDNYIKSDFTIKKLDLFCTPQKICNITQAGEVKVIDGEKNGAIVLRITQGENKLLLPPELMVRPPRLDPVENIKEIGLLEIDHSFMCQKKFDKNELKNIFNIMHINSDNVFESTVSDEGMAKWK